MRVVVTVTFAASLLTQQPAPGTAQPPPTFASGTQVVQVDARVFAKDGHFVAGLTPADFEIKEDGIPQRIVGLTLVGAPAAGAQLPGAGSQLPDADSRLPAAGSQLPPDGSQLPARSTWIFVFDTGHLSTGGLDRTRKAAAQFLQEKFHDGDLAGIVAEGKMANNRLTSVREELVKAASALKLPDATFRYQNEMTREWPKIQDEFEAWQIAVHNDADALQRAIVRACTEDPDACKRAPPDGMIRNKAQSIMTQAHASTAMILRSVEALSNGLARMPGPKTIVFFSEGFVILDMENALRDATGIANRAGAHFYTIDARGLGRGRGSSIIDQKTAFDSAGAFGSFDMQEDGTNALAVDTGGIAIRNENNIGRALDEIQQDAATYYVIGYTPSNQTFDGKFRRIDVTVTRPDLKVRARRGYLALEPAKLIKPVAAASTPKESTATSEPATKGEDVPPAAAASVLSPAPAAPAAPTAADALRTAIDTHGLVQELRKSSDSAERIAPTKANDLAGKGWDAYSRGDLENAAVYLGQAAESSEAHPWVRYALGLADLALARYPAAVENWERVRHDVPEFEPVYFNLADGYMLQKDDESALKVLRDAQGRWPNDDEVWNATGILEIRRRSIDAAITAFTRATAVAPADSLGYFNLAKAYQMRAAQSQRFDSAMQKWVGGESDNKKAADNYTKYIQIGGPYVQQAKEALQLLNWK